MKERLGWVSNSSSSSFIVNTKENNLKLIIDDFSNYIDSHKEDIDNEIKYFEDKSKIIITKEYLSEILSDRLKFVKHISVEQFIKYVIIEQILYFDADHRDTNIEIREKVLDNINFYFDGLSKNVKKQFKKSIILYLIKVKRIAAKLYKDKSLKEFYFYYKYDLIKNCYMDKLMHNDYNMVNNNVVNKIKPYTNKIYKLTSKIINDLSNIIINNNIINNNTICFEVASDCGVEEYIVQILLRDMLIKSKQLVFIGREYDVLPYIGGVDRYQQDYERK